MVKKFTRGGNIGSHWNIIKESNEIDEDELSAKRRRDKTNKFADEILAYEIGYAKASGETLSEFKARFRPEGAWGSKALEMIDRFGLTDEGKGGLRKDRKKKKTRRKKRSKKPSKKKKRKH